MIVSPYIILNLGYFLSFLALLVKDILILRLIIMTSQSIMLYFAYQAHNPFGVVWNILFICINLVWSTLIIRERMPVELNGELGNLYHNFFPIMTPQEFLKLWSIGDHIGFEKGEYIMQEKEVKHQLLLLTHGEAVVIKDQTPINTLTTGNFIGEMSYLTQGEATADVVAGDQMKATVWSREQLTTLAKSKPNLWHKLESVIGHDLIKKIVLTSAKVR